MVRAYLLIQTVPKYQSQTRDLILSQYGNNGIKAVDITSGPYDLIAVYDKGNLEDLITLDLKLKEINGIDKIFTLLVMHDANT